MVPQSFLAIFQSSVETGGALVGLLFVAVTIAPEQSLMHASPMVRRSVAANTFTPLANAFFVSLVALLPSVNLGIIAVVMGTLAAGGTALLGRQVTQTWRAWRATWWRAFVLLISMGVYGLQVIEGVRLLLRPTDTTTVGVVAVVVVVSYAMGLWRAWDLLGGLSYYVLGSSVRSASNIQEHQEHREDQTEHAEHAEPARST